MRIDFFFPLSLMLNFFSYIFGLCFENYKFSLGSVYSRVSNRRGSQNEQGGWQISAKIIKEEGAINEQVGKNLQS